MERYTKVLTIKGELVQQDCPVVFEKGALLKDNKLERNVLQLQFSNMGYQKIKAVFVEIFCYDILGKLTNSFIHSYLDLSVGINEKFGDREPVIVTDLQARNFVFSVKNIVFESGLFFESTDKMEEATYNIPLSELGELRAQFVREIDEINHAVKCVVKPVQFKGLWQCTCGYINHNGNTYCGNCRISQSRLFGCLDIQKLEENNARYLEKKEREEAEKRAEEERKEAEKRAEKEKKAKEKEEKKAHKKKTLMKIGRMMALLVCLSGIAYSLIVFLILPQMKYTSAIQEMEAQDYYEAYKIFDELGDFKDSEEKKNIVLISVQRSY